MNRKILSGCVSIISLGLLFTTNIQAQDFKNIEPNERMGVLWSNALEHIRVKYGVSIKEFQVFQRFENNPLHLLRASAQAEARKENFDLSLLKGTAKEYEQKADVLYQQFVSTEKQFPTSVNEYRRRVDFLVNPCDSAGCTNMNFNEGTLDTWYGYYADNTSSASSVDITSLVGGLLGSVTEACNDPNTMAYENADCSRSLVNDYQISITSGGYDYLVPSIPRVSPWASGGHSVMLGDSLYVGAGAAILSKTFYVTTATSALTYQYAVFLANPSHVASQQPFFNVSVLDENGDTITDCGRYNVVSGVSTIGFDTIASFSECSESFPVYYRPWTIVNVPLKAYIGHCVTIEFEVADCEPGGHFGYAYVDCSCSPAGVIASSPAFCGEDSLELTAPPGAQSYAWTGPSGGILSDTTHQFVWVQDSGTYTVVTIPVTGVACSDTITIHIPKLSIPPPTPSFRADTVCAGQPTHFTNTSDSAHGTFSWDFYNIGVYNLLDTNNFNPTWTYVNPGKYVVKLNQMLNGCGADVFDTVIVDTTVENPRFTYTATASCFGDTTYFAPTAAGATIYDWNFGDPASGTRDSSRLTRPGHFFGAPGTYTVTLFATNQGGCGAKDSQTVIINFIGVTTDTLTKNIDSVCPGNPVILTVTASGGTSPFTYSWSTGGTTSSITVSDTVTTTYTATVKGACDSVTRTITTVVIPLPKPVITGPTWRCKGTRDTLTVTSSINPTTYKWNNGSTKSTYITGDINGDSLVYVIASNSLGCSDSVAFPITIRNAPVITISKPPTACSGDSVELVPKITGTGPYTFSWSPNGQTSDSISVPSPADSSTATYTAFVSNGCTSSKTITITAEYPVLYAVPTQTVTMINDTISPAFVTLWANGNSVKYFWQDSLLVTCVDPSLCDTVRVSPTVTTTYTVTGYDKAGCEVSGYVTVVVDVPCFDFKVPNVFTPNYPGAYGRDNVFYVETENIAGWSISIYDRWGKEMYTSSDVHNYWNGTNKNGDMGADGVYYYIITGVCKGNTYKKEGFVQLIR